MRIEQKIIMHVHKKRGANVNKFAKKNKLNKKYIKYLKYFKYFLEEKSLGF